jgi:hypothetical protein
MVREVIELVKNERGRFSPSALETTERLALEFKDELALLGLAVETPPGSPASYTASLSRSAIDNPEHQPGQTRQGLLLWWEARFRF